MTVIKSLDFILGPCSEIYTCNYFSPYYNRYYKSFAVLKSGADDLELRARAGKFNPEKAQLVQNVIDFLTDKIDGNKLFYEVGLTNDLLGPLTTIYYRLSDEDFQEFRNLKQRFRSVFTRSLEFKNAIDTDRCSRNDTEFDHLIQKVNFQFPYEITDKKLIVVVDRDNIYFRRKKESSEIFDPGENTGSNYLYINDPLGGKWKSPGIPIGPRRITETAETLEILDKNTRKSLLTDLPIGMKESILKFIKQGRPAGSFVCFSFVKLLHPNLSEFEYCEFAGEDSLSPGDVISLTVTKPTGSTQTYASLKKLTAPIMQSISVINSTSQFMAILGL